MEPGAGLGENPPHAAGEGELRRAGGDPLVREIGGGHAGLWSTSAPPLLLQSSEAGTSRPSAPAPPRLLGEGAEGGGLHLQDQKVERPRPVPVRRDGVEVPQHRHAALALAAQLRNAPPAGFSCAETMYTRPPRTVGRSWNRLPSAADNGSWWSDPA
jgi:hypothetical protein